MGLKGGGPILLARPPRTQALYEEIRTNITNIMGGARWMRAVTDTPTALHRGKV
jgi:hypothetical protein